MRSGFKPAQVRMCSLPRPYAAVPLPNGSAIVIPHGRQRNRVSGKMSMPRCRKSAGFFNSGFTNEGEMMSHNAQAALLLIGSYLIGSLPFGLWIARWWKGVDIRTVGSGNIGATNVGRVCGPTAGGLVFVLDVLKGLVPPLIAHSMSFPSPWPLLAGLLAILGHNYPVWLGFK